MWGFTGGGSCTLCGGTLTGLGKKNADAEGVMDPAQSTARTALNKPLLMKDAFPIGGLLSFPGRSTVRRQIRRFGQPVKLPILA
jgi:hypothetical protein